MRLFFAFFSGGLFGLGLIISGMTNTAKVQGWLDIFGAWDPTLAFVLGGAILPMLVTWRIAQRRSTAILGAVMPNPPVQKPDVNVTIGSLLFGAGWGLAGLCPGPAMASLSFGGVAFLVFFAAMAVGMACVGIVRKAPISRLLSTQKTARG